MNLFIFFNDENIFMNFIFILLFYYNLCMSYKKIYLIVYISFYIFEVFLNIKY